MPASLRARDNPFRAERMLSLRYQFAGELDWPSLLTRLERLHYCAAIVGPKGSGKTTLQENLADQLTREGRCVRWLRFQRENRQTAPQQIRTVLGSFRSNDMLFVDGAEQLGPLRWRQLRHAAKSCGGLVVTVHMPGRLPTLHQCRTSPELLREIVHELLSAEQRPTDPYLDDLFQSHDGNLRLCLRELYDVWARGTAHKKTHGE